MTLHARFACEPYPYVKFHYRTLTGFCRTYDIDAEKRQQQQEEQNKRR